VYIYFPAIDEGSGKQGEGTRWFPGHDLRLRRSLYKSWLLYVAERYKCVLRRHIKQQFFQEKFAPLSPQWMVYKKSKGWHTGYWIATGELEASITVEWNMFRQAWVVGPDRRAKHSKTGTNMTLIIRSLEYGTDKIPARPLFAPTLLEVRGNLRRYYRQWRRGVEKKAGVAL